MRIQKSYLLRLWSDGKQKEWRASLEDVRNRNIKTFGSISELTTFLQQENKEKVKAP